MPRESDLPQVLANLAYRNGFTLRGDPYFRGDVGMLIARMKELLNRPHQTPPARAPESQQEPKADIRQVKTVPGKPSVDSPGARLRAALGVSDLIFPEIPLENLLGHSQAGTGGRPGEVLARVNGLDVQKRNPIFVCHTHADDALCDRYVEALRERGLDVWYDRTNLIATDQNFQTEIGRELERRKTMLAMVSPASLASYWVHLEVQSFLSLMAGDRTRVLFPVRIAACELPAIMKSLAWIDAVNMPFESAVDAIATNMQLIR